MSEYDAEAMFRFRFIHYVESWEAREIYNSRVAHLINDGHLTLVPNVARTRPVQHSSIDHPPGTVFEVCDILTPQGHRVGTGQWFKTPDGTIAHSGKLDPTMIADGTVVFKKIGKSSRQESSTLLCSDDVGQLDAATKRKPEHAC